MVASGRPIALLSALLIAFGTLLPLAAAQNSTVSQEPQAGTYSPPPEPAPCDGCPPPQPAPCDGCPPPTCAYPCTAPPPCDGCPPPCPYPCTPPQPAPCDGCAPPPCPYPCTAPPPCDGCQPPAPCAYCGPATEPPKPFPDSGCAQRMFESKPAMDAFFHSIQADWQEFPDDLPQAERDAKAKAIHEAQNARLAELRATFGDCGQFLPLQVPMPPMGPPPGGHFRPGEEFRPGDPAFADDPARRELAGKAHAIRTECEGRVRGLLGDLPPLPAGIPMPTMPFRPMPGQMPAMPATMPPPDGPMRGEAGVGLGPEPPLMPAIDLAVEQKVREIHADCEARIRAMFREHEAGQGPQGIDETFGSLSMEWDEAAERVAVTGRFLSLQGDPETQTMMDISCNGPLYVERLAAEGFLAEFDPADTMTGTALHVRDADRRQVLALHDNPRCTLNVAATPSVPSVVLDLADYLACEEAGGDIRCDGGDGAEAVILGHGGHLSLEEGNAVTVLGRATFLVSDGSGADLLGDAYEDAVKGKRVGAEVRIAKGADGIAVDAAAIGDLEVEVTGEENLVTATIDSAAGAGKTVSLQVDRKLFDADGLAIRVEAIGADGAATDLAAREADSIADVLDPGDDGDAPEFWVVQDKNGFQVLVSFPHFSTKKVTIEPAAAEVDEVQPHGVPAPSLLLAAGLLAVAAAVLRRRIDW